MQTERSVLGSWKGYANLCPRRHVETGSEAAVFHSSGTRTSSEGYSSCSMLLTADLLPVMLPLYEKPIGFTDDASHRNGVLIFLHVGLSNHQFRSPRKYNY